jgi:protein ImuB
MLWAALLLQSTPSTPPSDEQLRGLATWALQFSPRVAIVEDAVVLEVESSVRLYGGRRALRDRMVAHACELDVVQVAWAPTSLAAIAFARAGKENGVRGAVTAMLDALPMDVLAAARPHLTTLTRLGCRLLGDVRALPRGGIGRRFDKDLLLAMDQAYGLRPEAHAWTELPESFKARLELMSRVDTAPALLFGARRLVMQLCGWLAARHCGTTAFTLRWVHDAMRPKGAGEGGELTIRTAAPMRDVEHLCRLLAENLAKIQLAAPAGDIELEALDVHPLQELSKSLLPDAAQSSESMTLVLERVAARLGPDKVRRPVLLEDHRLEWQTHWQPAPLALPRKRARRSRFPQPSFILPTPLRLAMRGDKPMYQGVLQLRVGPHRIEGGWWHRIEDVEAQTTATVVRDYWVAQSPQAGFLWVFHERLGGDATAWYLHGSFS